MIKLGFADEEENYDPELEEQEKEEKHGTRFDDEPRKPVYISPKRKEAIMKSYDCVVVNDFGDDYHLSEEERAEKNKFYEAFKNLRRAKRKYRKLNEFIRVFREAVKCLRIVAEGNGIYDPVEFIRLYRKGDIYINGLQFPKYVGKDRKEISWDYINDFIYSGKDVDELFANDIEDLDEMGNEELAKKLFSEEELAEITRPETPEESRAELEFFDIDEDTQNGKNIAVELTEKQTKGLIKLQPELVSVVRDIKKSRNINGHLANSFIHELSEDDFDHIERYDQRHGYKSSSDMPVFKGDLSNSKDYHKYMAKLEEYEYENIRENYEGKMRTRAEIEELELKSHLAEAGWDIRALYSNKEREKKLKRAEKRDRMRENQLKKQLAQLDKRKKRRMGEDVDDDKKKKDKKKNKKNKESEKIKKGLRQDMNDVLIGDRDSWKDHKEEVTDWSWDSIIKG